MTKANTWENIHCITHMSYIEKGEDEERGGLKEGAMLMYLYKI